jgi:hypothetical protein
VRERYPEIEPYDSGLLDATATDRLAEEGRWSG